LERRNHNRLAVKLAAIVQDKMYRSWNFVIENYGVDGLQLFWREQGSMPDSFSANDLLEVHFEIAQQGQLKQFSLEVNVVRIMNNSLGVSLFNPALDAIAQLSQQQLRDGSLEYTNLYDSLDKHSQSIIEAIKHSFMVSIAHVTEIFLPIAHNAFFLQAQKTATNNEQALYFDAINTLNKSKKQLKESYLSLIQAQLDNCGRRIEQIPQTQNDGLDKLDLIDQNEFENWLVVNQLITETSNPYAQDLSDIKLRLAALFKVEENKIPTMPFSPEIIFSEFSHVIHQYFVNNNVLLILYKQFEKVINSHLLDVYKEINQIFINNNIVPEIADKKYEIKKQSSKENHLAENRKHTDVNNTAADNINSVASNTSALYSFAHQTELNSIENNVNLVTTYQTLKDLLSFQNGQGINAPANDFIYSDEYHQQMTLLLDELTRIQKAQTEINSTQTNNYPGIRVLVDSCLKKNTLAIELENEFNYTLDIIERLFNSISNDQWLGKPVKKLLLQLQIPILKVALEHKDFFESWSNPARLLINKLAIFDFDDEKNQFFIKANTFVTYLLRHFDRQLDTFVKVQQALDGLLEIQLNYYNKKINHIIDNWTAQQIVTNELAARLAERPISIMIADFISYHWLPILVTTYLKKGKDSNQWSQYLQALDMLILSMSGDISDEFIEPDVILFIIKQGMAENGQYNKNIYDAIQVFLQKKQRHKNEICLNNETIIKLLINGYALSDKTAIVKINRGITDASSQTNNAIAQRLKINDYLIFKQNNKSKRIQLIWQSDNLNVFVFAGRHGQQEAVFNRIEVIELLETGRLVQTKDYDLPLLERSLYAIMGNVHDELAKQTSIDSLTGLYKQKDFVCILDDLLVAFATQKADYALCLIDIDQFSLINDTCGFDAGDQYIAEIAQLLKDSLATEITIGRYGIDEFIFIMSEQTIEQALQIADQQRQLINAYEFSWDNKTFTLSASIGLINMTKVQQSAVFLRAVVTAATIAKEMGRNRVHFMEYDALELNHRQELQLWATKIEYMVNHNQLNIRCQRIQPVVKNSVMQHYEMLLLVLDDNGSYMPPAEFIEAAELYHKMNEVDRWVINYVFNWFSEHLEQLEIMGGIAINLSGQSLNDIDFLDFIEMLFERYPQIPHEKICFEITETMAIANINFANNIIHAIKDMGCKFSLDDFGTGQSSYAYLKSLPVDFLKIDGVFIKDIVHNAADQAMVKSINEIGHFLGMKTIAEFVENDEIITVLAEIGVDYAQGFGVEKPILISDFMSRH